MANDYFDFLENNTSENKQEPSANGNDMVNLTVRADADCQVVCDGDFLFLVNANQITKEKVPFGQHIMQFISIDYPDAMVEKIVDYDIAGKNYLLIVNELKGQIAAICSQKEEQEIQRTAAEKAKAENDAKVRAEQQEQERVKALLNIDFVEKYINQSDSSIKEEYDIVKLSQAVDNEIKPAVDGGSPSAAFVYSRLLEVGLGVKKDDGAALKYLRMAAENGVARAQNNLGNRYYYGNGLPQDYEEAVLWYLKAVAQNLPAAQNNLGEYYFYGQGVPQDYTKAAEWYAKAAEQGYADAQYNLGVCYDNGHGVPKNPAKAVEWYKKAAEQDNVAAKFELGIYKPFN